MEQQAHDSFPAQPAFSWQTLPAQPDTQRLRQHLAQQTAGAAISQVDRLETAFMALQAHGVLARHDYSCCSTCGSAEIRDEMAGAVRAGQPVDGFVFYHWQDTDDAAAAGRLALSFGSRLGGPKGVAEIGGQVAQALRDAGLQIEWDGSVHNRIGVALTATA